MEGIIYVVKIKISYHEARFEFDSIKEAGRFIEIAILHKVKGKERITISMTVNKSGEEEEDDE